MIFSLSSQGASLSAASHQGFLAGTPNGGVNNSLDVINTNLGTSQVGHAHQANTTPPVQQPSDDVIAFYTVGHDTLSIPSQPASMSMANMEHFQQSDIAQGYQENNGTEGLYPDANNIQAQNEQSHYTNVSNLFTDSANFLQKKGGPSDPLAMFKLQEQMVETTLNWSLYGQMASKAVSGIQSLFNNQV